MGRAPILRTASRSEAAATASGRAQRGHARLPRVKRYGLSLMGPELAGKLLQFLKAHVDALVVFPGAFGVGQDPQGRKTADLSNGLTNPRSPSARILVRSAAYARCGRCRACPGDRGPRPRSRDGDPGRRP